MKKIIFLTYIVVLASTLFSCEDFLAEDPKGQLATETFYSTKEDLDMAVYALYTQVCNTQQYTNMMSPRWQGDDMTTSVGGNKGHMEAFDRFTPSNDDSKGVKESWGTHYKIIQAANGIIKGAPKAEQASESERNIAIGQAKYWRAYAYFYLVRLFGDLPLNVDNTGDDYTKELSSVEDVYALIVEDLKDAESKLPTSYSVAPRFMNGVNVYITQQATKATLSAVYMAMAGWPLNKTELYKEAAAKAKEVIDGVEAGRYEYFLNPEFKDVYSMGKNYNNETVVGINNSPKGWWWLDSQWTSCGWPISLGGWGDGLGEIKFWMDFPAGPRKDATYNPKIRVYDKETKNIVYKDWWELPEQQPIFSVWSVNIKPSDPSELNDTGAGEDIDAPYDYTLPTSLKMLNDHRHRVIRYSEVLLWYAESTGRSGSNDAKAIEALNKVRVRAGLSPLSGLSAEALAEAAYNEHGWEIAGYQLGLVSRRDDQMRMNRLKTAFEERAKNIAYEVAPGVKVAESVVYKSSSWNDNMAYIPYPYAETKNPNIVRK